MSQLQRNRAKKPHPSPTKRSTSRGRIRLGLLSRFVWPGHEHGIDSSEAERAETSVPVYRSIPVGSFTSSARTKFVHDVLVGVCAVLVVLLRSTLITYLPPWPSVGAGGGEPGCGRLDAGVLPEGRAEAGAEDGRFGDSHSGVGIVRFDRSFRLVG